MLIQSTFSNAEFPPSSLRNIGTCSLYLFLYGLIMLASWVSDPSGLPFLDDVAGHGPFDILDRRWYPAVCPW